MPLREAISFLRGAVDHGASSRGPAVYAFHDGWAYARGPSILAAYPIPMMTGTFGIAADDLDAALGRMKAEPTIAPAEGAMVISSGRLKSTIDLFEVDPPDADPDPGEALPAGLLAALERALPFASKEGTWQRDIQLRSGAVRAISNAAAIEVDVPDLALAAPIALGEREVLFLVASDPPATWHPARQRVSFSWISGAFALCQLGAYPFPAVVDTVLEQSKRDCSRLVDDAFREAVADLAALGDDYLDLTPDGLVGKSAHATHAVEFATGVERKSRWRLGALKRVVAVADAWDPRPDAPSAFRGPGLRGVVLPLREGGR